MSAYNPYDRDGDGFMVGLIGAVWAGLLSWTKWHSIGYAMVHALLGYFYVIYYYIRY